MTVLIPFAGLSPVPWKNGGGSTIEIAIGPSMAICAFSSPSSAAA